MEAISGAWQGWHCFLCSCGFCLWGKTITAERRAKRRRNERDKVQNVRPRTLTLGDNLDADVADVAENALALCEDKRRISLHDVQDCADKRSFRAKTAAGNALVVRQRSAEWLESETSFLQGLSDSEGVLKVVKRALISLMEALCLFLIAEFFRRLLI